MSESHTRSLLKALSWRIFGTVATAIVALVVTGEIMTALTIGAVEFFLKFFIFYAHERIWQAIPERSRSGKMNRSN
jgi:uncharacterized membrane protein